MLSTMLLVLIFPILSLLCHVQGHENDVVYNERPIVGVLAQEQSSYLEGKYPGQFTSYIAASYVKSVESAGARVVPIWIGQKRSYYENIMTKVNGILFPGGGTFFNQSNGYADAGEHIFNIAKILNDQGVFFPLWGTCLGFELFAYLDAGRVELRADCHADRLSLPLVFVNGFRQGRLFREAPNDVIEVLTIENVTSNFHQYCITKKVLFDYDLDVNWKVLSLNNDDQGFEFISTFEHERYPFYGVQFHPEKNLFEWVLNRNIAHTASSVRANRYFMDFFVGEARKNRNEFASVQEERDSLIYNYATTYTGRIGSAFEECYLFP